MNNVIKFPDGPMGHTVARRFNELFAQMDGMGLTSEQQVELMNKAAKDLGLVEVDGVWQLPLQDNGTPDANR